ncbi:MAG: aminopeptidase P family N-terminal domain-containing protein, partial [Desulfobacterales bacterium]
MCYSHFSAWTLSNARPKNKGVVVENLIAERISRLRELLPGTQTDTLLVLTDENRRYLSGFTGQD